MYYSEWMNAKSGIAYMGSVLIFLISEGDAYFAYTQCEQTLKLIDLKD